MSDDALDLRHILDAIAAIEGYTVVGRDRFFAEPLRQDAIIRQLEIIGEATKRLSADLRSRHPEVAWRCMAVLQDVLIHNYAGVDLDVVWAVAQKRLPEVRRGIVALLDEEQHA